MAGAQLPGKNLLAAAGELQVSLDRLLETDQQLRLLPASREQLANSLLKLQADLRAAERDQADLAGQLKQHEEQHSAAASCAEQAASALAAAQRLQDAYRREQPPQAESQSAGSVGPPSAVEAEYSRLRAESQSAQTQLEIVRVPYEAMRQRWGEAQRRIESCQQQITESLRLQESLAQQESTLRQDLSRAQESMRPALDNLRTQADRFRAAVKPLASTSALLALDSLSFHQSHHRGSGAADRLVFSEPERDTASPYSQDKTILARFVESLQEQIKSIENDLAQSEGELKKLWKERCQELLGEPLPEDASRQSL